MSNYHAKEKLKLLIKKAHWQGFFTFYNMSLIQKKYKKMEYRNYMNRLTIQTRIT